MAITCTHVWTDKNQLVYLLNSDGSPASASGNIPAAGGATPDLVTDAANNTFGGAASVALTKVVRAGLDGLGTVAAGAWVQADARALLMLDGSTGIGGVLTPRTKLRLMKRTGVTADWIIDANVDGSGRPRIDYAVATAAGTAYLYVELNHSLAA